MLSGSIVAISALLFFLGTPAAQSSSTTTDESRDSNDKYNSHVNVFNAANGMFFVGNKGMSDLPAKYQAQNLGDRR